MKRHIDDGEKKTNEETERTGPEREKRKIDQKQPSYEVGRKSLI